MYDVIAFGAYDYLENKNIGYISLLSKRIGEYLLNMNLLAQDLLYALNLNTVTDSGPGSDDSGPGSQMESDDSGDVSGPGDVSGSDDNDGSSTGPDGPLAIEETQEFKDRLEEMTTFYNTSSKSKQKGQIPRLESPESDKIIKILLKTYPEIYMKSDYSKSNLIINVDDVYNDKPIRFFK